MRGITKQSPPTNVSPEGQQVCSMAKAAVEFRLALARVEAANRSGYARNRFDDLYKPPLRTALAREQHHLCVYCERRLNESSDTPVEHWRPLNVQPEQAFDWENLYLSCSTDGTCDDAKEGNALAWGETDPSIEWPTRTPYERCVGFTSDGKIYVRATAPLTPAQRQALAFAIANPKALGRRGPARLDLNHPVLVAARKAAIDAERDRRRGRPAGTYRDRAALRAEGERYLQQPRYPAFVSIRVAWWAGTLGAP